MGILPENPQAYNFKEEFFNYLKAKGLMDRTINEYLSYLKFFQEGLESEPTGDYINKFLRAKKNNMVARSFLKNYLTFIKRLDLSPPKLTGSTNKSPDMVEYISREEINKISLEFENTADKVRNQLMLAITFQGALRESELLSLTPLNFQWKEWLENQDSILEGTITGKRNKKRKIYLAPGIASKLYDYIEVVKSQLSFSEGEDKNSFRLFSNSGNGIGARRWREILGKVSLKAIGRKIHPHLLRHSFAMYAKDVLGWSLEKISKYLGHSSLQTTLIYARTTDPELKNSFNQAFNN